MRSKVVVGALALVTFLGTCAMAQEQGTQTGPAQSAEGSQARAQAAAPAPTETPTRIQVSAKDQAARLEHPVVPVYPDEAKHAHISGTVALHAIIAKDGSVLNLDYVSGHPLLMKAAMDAVKQWRYRPTKLNGEPVEVDTTISVVFTLGGEAPPAEDQGTQTNAAEKPIDPQLKADILHLLDVTHAKDRATEAGRATFQSMRQIVVQSTPPTPNREKIVDSYFEKILALFQTEDFTDGLVAVYSKYFSDDDIKGLIQFYETPTGQHFNQVMPQLMTDSFQFGQQFAAEKMGGIFSDLCKEYPELEGAAQFCPKQNKDDKSLLIEPNSAPARNLAEALGGK